MIGLVSPPERWIKNRDFMSTYHVWVSNRSGLHWALFKDHRPFVKKGDRLKYLGYTSDAGWPKKMSTGRVIYNGVIRKSKRKLNQAAKN